MTLLSSELRRVQRDSCHGISSRRWQSGIKSVQLSRVASELRRRCAQVVEGHEDGGNLGKMRMRTKVVTLERRRRFREGYSGSTSPSNPLNLGPCQRVPRLRN